LLHLRLQALPFAVQAVSHPFRSPSSGQLFPLSPRTKVHPADIPLGLASVRLPETGDERLPPASAGHNLFSMLGADGDNRQGYKSSGSLLPETVPSGISAGAWAFLPFPAVSSPHRKARSHLPAVRLLLSQPIQGGGKINHIPICAAAKTVVTPIQLHAWGFIVMERAASHPVPTYMDSIMLRSLSCCDGLLHSFKYIQIYPSLKTRKAPDILRLKIASAC